ncbi:unnamed protein product [Phytomonas sp. Hart1]|nr:unnamed protein product [Phytomonas sp. Hart1]|eukprot:CCW69327.1 unnamed protein product [Phytomonas sp. isolate Hart1]
MSPRHPLPLRFVRGTCMPHDTRATALVGAGVQAVYKPCGLPYYSPAQVAAAGDGRRLFTIRQLTGSSNVSEALLEGGLDASDSLLGRATELGGPGAMPHLALPLVSPLRLGRVAADVVNGWTALHKGLTLLASAPGEALFLRNAARMGLVGSVHRVLCRLPCGIGQRARREASRTNSFTRAPRLPVASPPPGEVGIPIHNANGTLPMGIPHDPLIKGGFIHFGLGVLRYEGSLSAALDNRRAFHGRTSQIAQQKRRLNQLFLPFELRDSHQSLGTDAEEMRHSSDGDELPTSSVSKCRHAWIPDEHLLGVSFSGGGAFSSDNASRRKQNNLDADNISSNREVHMEYKLLALSPNPSSDLALYEVRAHDLTSEEIRTLFAAEGFFVLNDFENDNELAFLMERVASEIRRTTPATLVNVPMNLQHMVRNGSAEELVFTPLIKRPLECADYQALRGLMERRAQLVSSGVVFEDDPLKIDGNHAASNGENESHEGHIDEDSEFLLKIEKTLQTYNSKSRSKYSNNAFDTISSLLFDVLSRHSAEEQQKILNICLGTGVECIGISYPDPADLPTIHSMQELHSSYEKSGGGNFFHQLKNQYVQGMKFISHYSLGASDSTGTVQVDSSWLLRQPSPNISRSSPKISQGMSASFIADVSVSFAAALLSAPVSAVGEEKERMDVMNSSTKTPLQSHDQNSSAITPPLLTNSSVTQSETSTANGANSIQAHPLHHTVIPVVYQEWFKDWFEAHTPPSKGDSSHQDGMLLPMPLLTPWHHAVPFIRAEELGDFVCAICGGTGHPWQCCPRRPELLIHPLPPPPSRITGEEESNAIHSTIRGSVSSSRGFSVMNSEPLDSLEDLTSALAAAEDFRADRSLSRAEGGALRRGVTGPFSPSDIIAVPNQAPTLAFHANALLRKRGKPTPPRRARRCAYCHGRHSLADCPGLSGADVPVSTGVSSSLLRAHAKRLFCIHCGATGHLFADCPGLPAESRSPSRCQICGGDHTPLRCPRRRTPPSGYFANGIPQDLAKDLQRDSTKDTLPKKTRRGGSMLIADSFVSSKFGA